MLRVERIMAGPIDNLLVIEASEAMPGAMAAMLLADHGAEVIKVEPAGGSVFARDLTRKGWDRGKRIRLGRFHEGWRPAPLLDEIVSAKPELDRTRFHSPEELRQHGLQHLRDAVALLESKAPGDVEAYRRFAIGLAGNVADAHREHGNDENASEAERAAITEIAGALGTTAT